MASSDLKFLRKVLRDETNRRILILLHEKEALTSEELTDTLIMTPSLLNYHLSVLNDLVNKTVDDKYTLSEKGKQSYASLNDLTANTGVSRRWKITWLISIVINIVIASFLVYAFDRPPTSVIQVLIFLLAGLTLAYALKVKPKITGRLVYIQTVSKLYRYPFN